MEVLTAQSVSPEMDNPRNVLREFASVHRAEAAVRIRKIPERSAGLVEMFVNQDKSTIASYRKLEISISADRDAAEIASIRAAEAVRAALYELNIIDETDEKQKAIVNVAKPGRKSEQGDEKPKAVVKGDKPQRKIEQGSATEKQDPPNPKPGPLENDDTRSNMLGVLTAFAVMGSPGQAGAIGALEAAVRWLPVPELSLRLDGAISLFGKGVESQESEATVDLVVARIVGAWEMEQKGLLRPNLG